MLTEDQVRDLLHVAGDTIDVAPSGPVIAPSPRRPWLITGAALAVAATVVAVFVSQVRQSDDPGRKQPIAPPSEVLRADQVPSVFGMPAPIAEDALQEMGAAVEIRYVATCREVPGRALSTEPATGTRIAPNDVVTLNVSRVPAAARCALLWRYEAWAFLDFANGYADAPRFADPVSVYVDDNGPRLISRANAADSDRWAGELDSVIAAMHQIVQTDDENGRVEYATPVLRTHVDDGSDFVCGGRSLPPPTNQRQSLWLSIGVPTDGPTMECLMVNLFFSPDAVFTGDADPSAAVIDTVVIRTDAPAESTVDAPVPDVVGLSDSQARRVLRQAGFAVRVESRESCQYPKHVLDQRPAAGSEASPGSTVTLYSAVAEPDSGCPPTAALADVARLFTVFAGGDDLAPPFAAEVELLIGNEPVDRITRDQALAREGFAVCTTDGGYAERSCPLSALAALREHDAGVTYSTRIDWCVDLEAPPPAWARDPEQSVVIGPDPTSVSACLQVFNVQLRAQNGLITAVNLLLGSP